MKAAILSLASWCVCLCGPVAITQAQVKEESTVVESINVFNEITATSATGIPQAMLKDAHGVAIVPRVIKAGFIVGARFGRGVLLVRDENNGWHAPVFISLTGGNVGYQIGVQSTDLILVFKTRKSVDGLLSGKFTVGADAAAAAGPLGRQAAAATDGHLKAEIYSYSRSRGLFAGVSVDGSVINVDHLANALYYQSPTPGAPAVVPPSAQQLALLVAQSTEVIAAGTTERAVGAVAVQPTLAQRYSLDQASTARDQLARFAPQLYQILDANWQNYLSLPAEIFQGSGHPTPQVLHECISRFEAVQNNPQYRGLAERPEFQSVSGMLKHYAHALSGGNQTLALPAPPAAG